MNVSVKLFTDVAASRRKINSIKVIFIKNKTFA